MHALIGQYHLNSLTTASWYNVQEKQHNVAQKSPQQEPCMYVESLYENCYSHLQWGLSWWAHRDSSPFTDLSTDVDASPNVTVYTTTQIAVVTDTFGI